MSLLFLALWSTSAWAVCDWDGDGFDGFHPPGCPPAPKPDCDDTDPAVSPAEPELMSDLVDNDCDQLTDIIRRPFFAGFWGGLHPEWTYGASTWGNQELVHVGPGSAVRLNGRSPGIPADRTSA